MKFATYLIMKHNAKTLIDTYRSIFDAELICEYIYDEDMTQESDLIGKIFHTELRLGKMNLYMSDSGEEPAF